MYVENHIQTVHVWLWFYICHVHIQFQYMSSFSENTLEHRRSPYRSDRARGRRSDGGTASMEDPQRLNRVSGWCRCQRWVLPCCAPAYLGRNALLSLLPHRIAYLIRILGTKCQQWFITHALITHAWVWNLRLRYVRACDVKESD